MDFEFPFPKLKIEIEFQFLVSKILIFPNYKIFQKSKFQILADSNSAFSYQFDQKFSIFRVHIQISRISLSTRKTFQIFLQRLKRKRLQLVYRRKVLPVVRSLIDFVNLVGADRIEQSKPTPPRRVRWEGVYF